MNYKKHIILPILILSVALVITGISLFSMANGGVEGSDALIFSGERAFENAEYQVSLGVRTPGSKAHAQVQQWIQSELIKNGWNVETQQFNSMGHPLVNIIGTRTRRDSPEGPWIIIAAHYDTRFIANRDPDPQLRSQAVPGANDGASGVAVLLELARVISNDLPVNVWLVFFDGEDNGGVEGWDWILGSRGFVERLDGKPDAVVILDMVGDRDLNLYWEKNSDPLLTREIWEVANDSGFTSQFIPLWNHKLLDDHIPFIEAGIPAVDIIDIDYPYWHTTADTIDKISPTSLKVVGETVHQWLKHKSSEE